MRYVNYLLTMIQPHQIKRKTRAVHPDSVLSGVWVNEQHSSAGRHTVHKTEPSLVPCSTHFDVQLIPTGKGDQARPRPLARLAHGET